MRDAVVGAARPLNSSAPRGTDQPRATGTGCGEQLVAVRVIDRAGEPARVVVHRDAHTPLRDPEQEVDGAVERIHHPAEAARAPLLLALLAEEAVVGPALGEQLPDRALGGEVRLAHEVGGRALARHLALHAPAHPLGEQRARHARRLDRHLEQRVGLAHENSGGRCCAQGRSASSCAASDRIVISSFGRPTTCTPRGRPSEPKPAGTDAAGWPVTFHTPL